MGSQQIEALVDGGGTLRSRAVPLSEPAVEVVEAGVDGVEDQLHVGIHGSMMVLKSGEVMMGKGGFQDR